MLELDTIDRTVQITHRWLQDIMDDSGETDRQRAWHGLRAVLATLRDRMPVSEAAQLSAQLPMLVRGLFWEGWDPDRPGRAHSRKEFLAAIAGHVDPRVPIDPEVCFAAVMRTLAKHVTAGELRDVRAVMPGEVQQMIDAAVGPVLA